MVEAITSSVPNLFLVRASAEQANVARSAATAEAKTVRAPQAPYISPYISVDSETNKVVLQIRNGQTGKVIEQLSNTSGSTESRTPAPTIQQVQSQQSRQTPVDQPREQTQTQTTQPTPAISSAGFGAFARQVSSLQSAVAGSGGTGGTVSLFA